ncbi:hypothetical protein BKA62DRAFT_621911 [Auriculariales sp. MPI-PUGE-AT-0066]|nr:hypothetical protein BKA62DRAFT_621911 [Auriculariales sp. MPI-PUGE-AT-0066]
MSSISRTIRHLSKTPMIPPHPATLPMEVPMIVFRDRSAPLPSPSHSRNSSSSGIMTEVEEIQTTPAINVMAPWIRL